MQNSLICIGDIIWSNLAPITPNSHQISLHKSFQERKVHTTIAKCCNFLIPANGTKGFIIYYFLLNCNIFDIIDAFAHDTNVLAHLSIICVSHFFLETDSLNQNSSDYLSARILRLLYPQKSCLLSSSKLLVYPLILSTCII